MSGKSKTLTCVPYVWKTLAMLPSCVVTEHAQNALRRWRFVQCAENSSIKRLRYSIDRGFLCTCAWSSGLPTLRGKFQSFRDRIGVVNGGLSSVQKTYRQKGAVRRILCAYRRVNYKVWHRGVIFTSLKTDDTWIQWIVYSRDLGKPIDKTVMLLYYLKYFVYWCCWLKGPLVLSWNWIFTTCAWTVRLIQRFQFNSSMQFNLIQLSLQEDNINIYTTIVLQGLFDTGSVTVTRKEITVAVWRHLYTGYFFNP